MSSTEVVREQTSRLFLGVALEAQRQIVTKLRKKKKKVIVLGGPTAVGKSSFAIELAHRINGEVISADSMQVYRGMDIGTAKLSEAEREGIPHYLIDIREVDDPFSVVDFYYEASFCLQKIFQRDGVPIIVGGSGFYIHSLLYGPPSGPPPVREVREELEMKMNLGGVEPLYERLATVDPEYAKTITKGDRQKIIRALEIITVTGQPVSRLAWKGRARLQNYDFLCRYLSREREELYQRIDLRCEAMIASGLINEVEMLRHHGLEKNNSAMQAIGYRQVLDFLKTTRSEAEQKQLLDALKRASRCYAKRQGTWFKKESAFSERIDLTAKPIDRLLDELVAEYEGK